jgi:hypothetical protein
MKLIIQAALAAAIVSLAFATPATASEPATAPHAQKTAENTPEKDPKAGGKDARPAHEPQTHKMVRCNEEAGKKQLRGDERRAFMSACLKG